MYPPQELGAHGAHLQDPAGQPLPLQHGWRSGQLLLLDQPAGDACGHGALPGGHDDPDAGVPGPTHGSTAGVHHEADQEAEGGMSIT